MSLHQWQMDKALDYLDALIAAEQGYLEPPTLPVKPAFGKTVNVDGTSCYIDSLIFAMFGTTDLFDPILTTPTMTRKSSLQGHEHRDGICKGCRDRESLRTITRMLVNLLRSGKDLTKPSIERFRQHLFDCGWQGGDRVKRQEDVAELFLFLVNQFDMPSLPIKQRLWHGGLCQKEDEQIVPERLVCLPFPDLSSVFNTREEQELSCTLELLLDNYFFETKVHGLARNTEDFLNDKNVEAWSALQVYPFWTPSKPTSSSSANNQEKKISNAVVFSDQRLAFPIALNRFIVDVQGCPLKRTLRVIIPDTLNFSKYTLYNNAKDPYLRLIAVVCHRGDSVQHGHFVTYAKRPGEQWWLFDDLAEETVEVKSTMEAMKEISSNGYLLFYELT